MISRRHIRLRILQALYSFFISENQDLEKSHKQTIKQIENVQQLYLLLVSLIAELVQYSVIFSEQQKNKFFPSDADKNPSENFANNAIVRMLLKDEEQMKKLNRVSGFWHKNDHDIIRKVFLTIWKSEVFQNYLTITNPSFEEDKNLLLSIFEQIIIEDQLVHFLLEEESIFWMDDLPFLANIIQNQIRTAKQEENCFVITTVFKNSEDKRFATDLYCGTILHHKEFEEIIEAKAKNWELERIAKMDQILIMMALYELMYLHEIPVKVSLNEYIEVAKYYSTENSKGFINGILDKVIQEFKTSGKIKKSGRGLLE